MPSFVSRVERPDRGGEWISYLEQRREQTESWVAAARPRPPRRGRRRALGRAAPRRRQRRGPARLLPVRVGERAGDRDPRPHRRPRPRRAGRAAGGAGRRAGQPPPPARARLRGAALPLRDRLRLRRLPRPAAPPDADLPVAAARPRPRRRRSRRRCAKRASAASSSGRWRSRAPSTSGSPRPGLAEQAPYALSLAYRIRYALDLNAREAMHLIELRSGREGHPTYRAVAQAMHERIAAVHPGVAAAMTHVDTSAEPRLERIMSEIRTHRKRVGAGQLRVAPRLVALAAACACGARRGRRSSPSGRFSERRSVPSRPSARFPPPLSRRASARGPLRPPPRRAACRPGNAEAAAGRSR